MYPDFIHSFQNLLKAVTDFFSEIFLRFFSFQIFQTLKLKFSKITVKISRSYIPHLHNIRTEIVKKKKILKIFCYFLKFFFKFIEKFRQNFIKFFPQFSSNLELSTFLKTCQVSFRSFSDFLKI